MSEVTTPSGFDGSDVAFADEELAGPVCEQCGAELPTDAMTACPSCGWYASLGIHVEVATDYEAACTGQATEAPPSHLEVWSRLVPPWGWALIGTTAAVAAASLAVRLLVIGNDALRTAWSVSQLAAGVVVALGCHLTAFFLAAAHDTEMGVMDIVVNPLRAWIRLVKKMPKRFWVLNTANASLSAALFAALIIGGLPYDAIWDWGIRAPVKKNLLGAIAEKASSMSEDEMSMEEAMKSFAQDAAVSGAPPGGGKGTGNASGELQRKEIDALVIGYQASPNGHVEQLLLATEHNGRLYYAGRVKPDVEPEEAAEFYAKLNEARSPRPFITVPAEGIWVQPRFTCRITYDKRVESGMLQGMIWGELMGEVKLPW